MSTCGRYNDRCRQTSLNTSGSQNGSLLYISSSSSKRKVDLNDRLSMSVSFALSLLTCGTYTVFAPRPIRQMRKVVLCSLLFKRLIWPRQCFGFSSSSALSCVSCSTVTSGSERWNTVTPVHNRWWHWWFSLWSSSLHMSVWTLPF